MAVDANHLIRLSHTMKFLFPLFWLALVLQKSNQASLALLLSLAECCCWVSSYSGSSPPFQKQWFRRFPSARSRSCQIWSRARANSAHGSCLRNFLGHQTYWKYHEIRMTIVPHLALHPLSTHWSLGKVVPNDVVPGSVVVDWPTVDWESVFPGLE